MKRIALILSLFASLSCQALVTNPAAWSLVLNTNGVVTAPASFWSSNRVVIATNFTVQGGTSNHWDAATMTLTVSTNSENALSTTGGVVAGAVTISTGNLAVSWGVITLGEDTDPANTNRFLNLNKHRIVFEPSGGGSFETSLFADGNGMKIGLNSGEFGVSNCTTGVSWEFGDDGVFRLNNADYLAQIPRTWNQTATGTVHMAGNAISNASRIAFSNGTALTQTGLERSGALTIAGKPLTLSYALSNTISGLSVTGAGTTAYNGFYTNSGSVHSGDIIWTNAASGTIAYNGGGFVILGSNTSDIGYFLIGTNYTDGWSEGNAGSPAPVAAWGGNTVYNLTPTNIPAADQVLTASANGTTRWAAGGGGGGAGSGFPLTNSVSAGGFDFTDVGNITVTNRSYIGGTGTYFTAAGTTGLILRINSVDLLVVP